MKYGLLIFVIMLGLVGCSDGSNSFFASVNRYWRDVDRAGTESSRQYVYSQISIMDAIYNEYLVVNEEAQRTYLAARMRRIASTIPTEEVPSYIIEVIEGGLR